MSRKAGGRKTRISRKQAEALLPPLGPVKQQVEMQLAYLTQNVMCATLRANQIPPPAEPDPNLPPVRQGNRWVTPSPSDQSAYRIAELQEAARMSLASARLIEALNGARTEFRQHYTVSHITTVEDPGKHKRSVTSWTGSFAAPAAPPGTAPDDLVPDELMPDELMKHGAQDAPTPPPPENGGSNADA